MATAVLHNLAILWGEEQQDEDDDNEDDDDEGDDDEGDDDEGDDDEDGDNEDVVCGTDQATRNRVRQEGTQEREKILRQMPMAELREVRRIRQNL